MTFSYKDYTGHRNFYAGYSPEALVDQFGSPLYVYNENILRERCRELKRMSSLSDFRISYSVKANSNPALLKIIKEEGLLVDAMSPGELAMDLLAGYKPEDILYISNNITSQEMNGAIENCCLVSVDSLSQLELLGSLNPGGKGMIRINPGLGAGHHDKVITAGAATKFGIDPARMGDALTILQKYDLTLAGLNQHIGSLFLEPDKYLAAVQVLLGIASKLPREVFNKLEILDFGGGFGIPYHKYEKRPRLDLAAMGKRMDAILTDFSARTGYQGKWIIEPGRYVTAECGMLLGQVTSVKNNGAIRFAGTDIGFNVMQRAVMYDAYHEIEVYGHGVDQRRVEPQTLVGNICESGDILARERALPYLERGDIIGICDTGAYGFSMASSYNERFLPAEALITSQGEIRLVRRRQTVEDLVACLV